MTKSKFRVCKCGCGKRVSKEQNKYIINHCCKGMLGKHHTKTSRKKMSVSRIKGLKNGTIEVWDTGLTIETSELLAKAVKKQKKTKSSKKWKETVGKEVGRKISATKKRLYKEGKIKNWTEGKTKETDERVMKLSKNISKTRRSKKWKKTKGREAVRRLKHTLHSKKWKETVGKESARKSSETQRRLHKNGKLKIWCDGLTKEIDERVRKLSLKVKRTVNSKKYKNTIGKKKIRKYKNTVNSEEYKNTKGKERNKKLSIINKKKCKDVKYKEKLVRQFLTSNKKPNGCEKLLIKLFKKHKIKFKYNSNEYGLILDGFCPDFVNKRNKKLIELNGVYWHIKNAANRYGIKTRRQEENRKARKYAKCGYKTLFIWDDELKDLDKVLEKVKKFYKEV